MGYLFRSLVDSFTSLKLTVVLLALSIVLVVFATIDQVNLGIWAVQHIYFRSFVALGHFPFSTVPCPLPGGYLVGGLLALNLLCAQFSRFTLTWRNTGLHLTHFGIVLLLVGELLTGVLSVESDMILDTGATRNYVEEKFGRELAVVDVTQPANPTVWSVPIDQLTGSAVIPLPNSDLSLRPIAFHANSQLFSRRDAPNAPASPATAGVGVQLVVRPLEPTYKPNEDNLPTALVEVRAGDTSLGVWLASYALEQPQTFSHAGHNYEIALRRTRIYLPFSLTLLEFRHDKYPGTDIPRNFSSQVRLISADGKENREVRIYMNNPLRYGGLTFYQAGFQNNDRTSILQVMRNPGWLLPYLACAMASAGLLLHFGISLFGFLGRRRTAPANREPSAAATPPAPARALTGEKS